MDATMQKGIKNLLNYPIEIHTMKQSVKNDLEVDWALSIILQHLPHEILWAPVSEPGFLDFHIFRLSILEFCFLQNICENYVGEIPRNK